MFFIKIDKFLLVFLRKYKIDFFFQIHRVQ